MAEVHHIADIDRAVQTGIRDKVFSAAACAGSKESTLFHRNIYGHETFPPPAKRIDYTTLFDLGSLTKPLAATLGCMLLAMGRLDLSRGIGALVPAFKNAAFKDVSVDMLLDHTSGLPADVDIYTPLYKLDRTRHPDDKTCGKREAIAAAQGLVAHIAPEAPPGTRTLYSDLNFLILGWVVEAVAQKPLDAFLAAEVFVPLGVQKDIFFCRHAEKTPMALLKRQFAATEECPQRGRLIQGEVMDKNAWAIGGVAGHAGLFATLPAVWHVAQTLLDCFHGRGRLVTPGVITRFWTRSRRQMGGTYALGWDTPCAQNPIPSKKFSRVSVGHSSRTGCTLYMDLNARMVGILLTNSAHKTPVGKHAAMRALRPRVFERIASFALAAPPVRPKPNVRR